MGSHEQPVYLLADSRLLFPTDRGQSVSGALAGRLPSIGATAAYVGAANGDEPAFYLIFQAAMALAGVSDCRLVSSAYGRDDREYLRHADLVLLAGGDVDRGWRVMAGTAMAEDVLARRRDGAILVGVSAGAALLGLQGWHADGADDRGTPFDTLQAVPWIIDAHEEARAWSRLVGQVISSGGTRRGLALPAGSGVVYHPDSSLEPVGRPVTEYAIERGVLVDVLLCPATGPEPDARPS